MHKLYFWLLRLSSYRVEHSDAFLEQWDTTAGSSLGFSKNLVEELYIFINWNRHLAQILLYLGIFQNWEKVQKMDLFFPMDQ